MEKRCSACGIPKDTDCFSPGASRCKDCRNRIQREQYASDEKYRNKRVAQNIQWNRSHADKQKLYAQQWHQDNKERNSNRAKKYHIDNRPSILAKQLVYRVEHREDIRQSNRKRRSDPVVQEKEKSYGKRYRSKNKVRSAERTARRRARIRLAPVIEKIDRDAIIARDASRCHICHKKVRASEMSLDHLIPISCGGSHTQGNLAVAHLSCNQSRGTGRLPAQLRLLP